MSTYKRVSGNLTIQTLNANDVVTIDAATVAMTGNLTVTGNATLQGNILGDRLVNGTTSLEIQSVNGNANVTVGGVSNVAVFTTGGLNVNGNVSVSGNIIGSIPSITGNVTLGNVTSTGNVFVTQNAANSTPTVRIISSNTAEASGTVLGSYEWFTNDSTTPGARTVAAFRANTTDAAGNARVDILTGTSATLTARISVLPTGNVGISNTAPLHNFAVSGNGFYSGTLTAVGNITGGNVSTAGLVTATGNVATGANLVAAGFAAITGNITGGNVISSGAISAGAGGVSATGNVTGGNITTGGIISATGNLTTTDITATSLSTTGNVTSANQFSLGIINAVGNITGANINANSDVVAGNVRTTGLVSATGNIVSGSKISAAANVETGGNLVSAGNVIANPGGFFVGDGGFLSNVTAASNVAVTQLANGTTNFTIAGTNGNITAQVNGVANIVVINASGLVANTTLSAVGNVVGGNVTTAGQVSATGNITGGNISATTGTFTTVIGAANASNLTTGTVSSDRLAGSYTINISGTSTSAQTVTSNGQPNITSVGILSSLSVTGNATAGNLLTGGVMSAAGNVTGNYLLGNITFATGFNASKIFNGTSEANIGVSGGNANITIGGTSNVVVVASTGVAVTGTMSASGNVTGSNLNTGGVVSAVGAITGAAITGTSLSVSTGNITGGNLLISGAIVDSAQLDIQTSAVNANIVLTPNGTGNVNLVRMSASGNVTAVAFYGNGAPLSSITGANVTGTVANATFATSAGSATTAGTVTTNAQPNITSVGTLSSLAVTANITGGNLSVSTGTITVGNIVNANGNGVGNIGSSTTYFNTVFAKATSAQYADLAEKYEADQQYESGTVLVFGGEKEVTANSGDTDTRVAGIVSQNPSYLMNSGLSVANAVAVALLGRVECKVNGPVRKGDLLVTAGNGRARVNNNPPAGTIVGKSLADFDGDQGTIEVVVGRT